MKIIILGKEYVEAPSVNSGFCAGCAGQFDGALCFKLPSCGNWLKIFVKAPEASHETPM